MARSNREYRMLDFELDGPGVLGGPTIAPFFVCATCGERITDGDANAVFEPDRDGGRTGSFIIVHRETCDSNRWEWQRLDSLICMLLHNSGYDLEALAVRHRQLRKREDDAGLEPESDEG
jgi:hypothetical protein